MEDIDAEGLKNVIERAQKGDKEAFSSLYTAYFAPLYRYIFFRVQNKDEAEDLTQEVFIKAYGSFNRYIYTGTSPLAYLYTIARNTIIDFRRKKKIIVLDENELLLIADDHDSPQDLAIKNQESAILHQAIAALTEDQQDVVVLHLIDGLPTSEVAAMLDKSEEAVRQIQSRALKILKKNIYEYTK
jgi:RNA polymerase sigma-70 factor (ECF subfamily)